VLEYTFINANESVLPERAHLENGEKFQF